MAGWQEVGWLCCRVFKREGKREGGRHASHCHPLHTSCLLLDDRCSTFVAMQGEVSGVCMQTVFVLLD